MGLPRLTTVTRPARRVFAAPDRDRERSRSIVVDSGNVDAGSTPTSTLRPGNVLCLVTATGRFVEANDAAGDRSTRPAITSSGHTDGNGVIRLVGNHGSISVTTTTGAGTEANNATDLNADADFAAHYTASSAAGELTITANNPGGDEWFYVHADTMATANLPEGEANGDVGTDADYVVIDEYVELSDNGTAVHNGAVGWLSGNFVRANLINLTPEAEATLTKRGSRFE